MEGPKMRLYSKCLLSKWGFGDGDMPEALEDYYDEQPWPKGANWHTALRILVRRHLVPIIEQTIEVYDIDTTHNPIRASSVEGQAVDDLAIDHPFILTPECVEVTWEQIEAAICESVVESTQ